MTNLTTSNQALFDALMNAQIPQVKTVSSKFSFGIVNSQRNGKRCSFSQDLVKKLDLTDEVFAMPSLETRKLVVGKALPFENALRIKLSKSDGRKIAYDAHFVEMLTEMFCLDFTAHVSQTFYNIEFDQIDNNTVAIISFPLPAPTAAAQTAQEIGNS